jgi:hypothetical protein
MLQRWGEAKKGHMADYTIEEVKRWAERMATAHNWESSASPRRADIEAKKKDGRHKTTLRAILAVLRWAADELQAQVDPRVIARYRGISSSPNRTADLMSDAVFRKIQTKADELGPNIGALIHYLGLYGARPITAAKLTIADFDGAMLSPTVKGRPKPIRHPLFPETIARLSAIAKGRAPTDALFLHPKGKPWPLRHRKGVGMADIPCWYSRALGKYATEGQRGIYQIKRRAITRMLNGQPPWKERLSVADVMMFTGHLTESQVLRYAVSSLDRARQLVGTVDTEPHPSASKRNQARKRKPKVTEETPNP